MVQLKKRYKYFLIDLDRTIWDFDANASENILYLSERFNLPIDPIAFRDKYFEFNNLLWSKYNTGDISKEELKRERFYRPLLSFGIDDISLSNRFSDEYLEMMPERTMLMPYGRLLLEEIKRQQGLIAIVTNGFKEVQHKKLSNAGLSHLIDALVISEEEGVQKPSPIIFKRALERIGGEKDWAIMIGDDFSIDIEGAMIFGIDQFYYNYKKRPYDGGATYESDDLRDILTTFTCPAQ